MELLVLLLIPSSPVLPSLVPQDSLCWLMSDGCSQSLITYYPHTFSVIDRSFCRGLATASPTQPLSTTKHILRAYPKFCVNAVSILPLHSEMKSWTTSSTSPHICLQDLALLLPSHLILGNFSVMRVASHLFSYLSPASNCGRYGVTLALGRSTANHSLTAFLENLASGENWNLQGPF